MILIPLLFFMAAVPETADSIMAKVAANQDRAEQARSEFVYHQEVLVRMNHTNGKLAHEQFSEYTVAPTADAVKRTRTKFVGKYFDHGKLVEYTDPKLDKEHVHIQMKDEMDRDMCTDFGSDLAGDSKSKDGIARNFFPLTGKEQKHYKFHLEGVETYHGSPVYHVTFEPKDQDSDRPWEGDVLVDQKEFQPTLVTTHLTMKIPVAVRVLLGTNIQNLGFKLTYRKFDKGLWFPVDYGGEMKVRALFFYARRIGISIRNSGFQRADVSSSVKYNAM